MTKGAKRVRTANGYTYIHPRRNERSPLWWRVSDRVGEYIDRGLARFEDFSARHEIVSGLIFAFIMVLVFGFVGGVENGKIWP